jgi:hypothetical protein
VLLWRSVDLWRRSNANFEYKGFHSDDAADGALSHMSFCVAEYSATNGDHPVIDIDIAPRKTKSRNRPNSGYNVAQQLRVGWRRIGIAKVNHAYCAASNAGWAAGSGLNGNRTVN